MTSTFSCSYYLLFQEKMKTQLKNGHFTQALVITLTIQGKDVYFMVPTSELRLHLLRGHWKSL